MAGVLGVPNLAFFWASGVVSPFFITMGSSWTPLLQLKWKVVQYTPLLDSLSEATKSWRYAALV